MASALDLQDLPTMEEKLNNISREGDINALYQLITEHTNHVFDEIDEKPLVDTPLHTAATSGKTHFALELMRLKPSFAKKVNPEGLALCILLYKKGIRSRTVLRLLDADKDLIRVQGKGGKTPLHHAAEQENLDEVLLDEFLYASPTSLEDVTNCRQTALHIALDKGKLKSVEIILKWCNKGLLIKERRKILNLVDEDGNTALQIATLKNQNEIVKELLKEPGIRLNAINVEGLTAFDISEQQDVNREEIKEMLTRAGGVEAASLPEPTISRQYYLSIDEWLKSAAKSGDINRMYALLKEDPLLLDCVDDIPFIDTPLHIAAAAGQAQFVMEIMGLKPSFARKQNQDGFTPMYLALQNGKFKILRRIVGANSDLIRAKGRDGKTLLHNAVEKGNRALVSELLSACPQSIEDVTNRSDSALHIAVKRNKIDVFHFLVETLRNARHKGSDAQETQILNGKDAEGDTALHIAAKNNQPQHLLRVVKALVACGVDLTAKNSLGQTALDISASQRQTPDTKEIMEMLRNPHGAPPSIRSIISSLERWKVSIDRYKENMTSDIRHVLLVVAVLIIAMRATYLGSVWQDKNAMATSIGSDITFASFWILNTMALLTTLIAIYFLLPSGYISTLLLMSLSIFCCCYLLWSMSATSPSISAVATISLVVLNVCWNVFVENVAKKLFKRVF